MHAERVAPSRLESQWTDRAAAGMVRGMGESGLDYDEIRYRLQSHGAFRFLRKEKIAFLIAFLIDAFKKRHRSDIPQGELVAELVEEVRRLALRTRDDPPPGRAFLSVEGDPELDLIMERPLYQPEVVVPITERPDGLGTTNADTTALFEADAVDLDLLRSRIGALLRDRAQTSLGEVAAAFPMELGVAELPRNERSGRAYLAHAPNVIFLPELPQ